MFSHDTTRWDFLFIVAASISWGTVGVANQILYMHSATNALSLAFLRLAIAAPLFLLASWLLPGHRLFPIKRRDLMVMLFMGGLQALYQASYSAAIPYAGVTVSTLIALCAAPVLVALFSTFITRERLTPATLLALVGALGGTVLLVVARAHPGEDSASLPGVCLAFVAACGYAGFILCGRRLSSRYHSLHINSVAFATGALLLLILALPTRLVVTYSAGDWLILLYLGCIPTALAYGLFQLGMRSLTATVVSIVTLLEALTAALLAWLLFHEELGPLGLVGAALLLGAMALILIVPAQ
ncbi:MAG: DMT family transporter [Chloroflexota bacterium]|nr:DMT family transporter [Chloroflexota bacterium]